MSEKELINTIANSLSTAHDNIQMAAQKAEKSATNVKLMAVSKTKPLSNIIAAYECGQRIFGENYAQELNEKYKALAHLKDIEWHYIGPIQSNKTQIVAEAANWVDSVDREKIAIRLNNHAQQLEKNLNILIQVNISNSDKKSGVLITKVEELADVINNLPHLTLKGLMAIPDQHDDKQQLKNEFIQMHTCFMQLQHQYPTVDTLSLGMSGDMDLAIASGSTMVRIGTAIFGSRN
ncbi:YggS family pyridoxal phosphate-dependent enzyme [Psychrosphaera sp. B3R10]|uniref:YggS family pyridoxal phosphate-dependent enzyme n=1 Tax=unclassified Psychrosphaera TaxID=2641570 RepID=UPI001C088F0E|nr:MULTISPECIES: YggS family pyridoxal phosphate-dependent enzyme [unclassified Psychrosphaera]MBU2880967.1 YggS family pyridoxal phosphate-dependent enzyme [Psychrosphaera sp. I2R16]MBU2990814.1 YggS family pyridoxal phosphate-dependent enzyme [Psychrosphaera sp. B3R10]